MPAIAWTPELLENDGLLMAYGPKVSEMYRRAATYVDRIGLTIPQALLQRADQVIE